MFSKCFLNRRKTEKGQVKFRGQNLEKYEELEEQTFHKSFAKSLNYLKSQASAIKTILINVFYMG